MKCILTNIENCSSLEFNYKNLITFSINFDFEKMHNYGCDRDFLKLLNCIKKWKFGDKKCEYMIIENNLFTIELDIDYSVHIIGGISDIYINMNDSVYEMFLKIREHFIFYDVDYYPGQKDNEEFEIYL